MIGALYQDPNTSINAAGRDFLDRAYIGKVETISHLPAWLGSLDVADIVDYLDGLVFARRLLVTGLPQGPFLVDTTVRGSPEGGNRAEFVMNWNLQLGRRFHLPFGQLITGFDLLNVTNVSNRIQESYRKQAYRAIPKASCDSPTTPPRHIASTNVGHYTRYCKFLRRSITPESTVLPVREIVRK